MDTLEDKNRNFDSKSFLGRSLLSLLILSVINLEGPCTGYLIIKKIRKMTDESLVLKAGTVYPVLEQLKENNLIFKESLRVENTIKNGFRIRSVYKITPTGSEKLYREWEKWTHLQRVLGVFSPREIKIGKENEN
jgi:DNA-binding PadR family transcriptional regulator